MYGSAGKGSPTKRSLVSVKAQKRKKECALDHATTMLAMLQPLLMPYGTCKQQMKTFGVRTNVPLVVELWTTAH